MSKQGFRLRPGRIALGVFGGLILVLIGYSWLFQSELVYNPSPKLLCVPSQINMAYEDLALTTEDNVKVNAWYFPLTNACGIVLICRNSSANMSYDINLIEFIQALQLEAMIFDYEGFGKSGGRPSEQGTYHDAQTAWKYLTLHRGKKPSEVVLWGNGMGGATAAWLAARENPAGLIIQSGYTSLPDLLAGHYKQVPHFVVRILCRYKYNTSGFLASVKCPVLIFHSKDDDNIPFEHGQKLLEAAHAPKWFIETGGLHGDEIFASRSVLKSAITNFVAQVGLREY